MKKICIVNNDFKKKELIFSLINSCCKKEQRIELNQQIKNFLNTKYCYFTSCGLGALYIILKSLKNLSQNRTEVILPAYTASGLVLPIIKLGLKVKLCDISLKTFNMDISQLNNLINKNTLAIIPVHMFGIPMNISSLIENHGKNIFIIEDFAQAFGTELNNKKVGTFSEVSFGSFGRGKNFSLYNGGCIILNSGRFKDIIEKDYILLEHNSNLKQIQNLFKFIIFSFIIQPDMYYFLSGFVSVLKTKKERTDFSLFRMDNKFRNFYSLIFEKWLNNYTERVKNGLSFYKSLKILDKLVLPEYPLNSKIVFNRFPVIIKDIELKMEIFKTLNESGIESSFLYGRPVHEIYNLGYKFSDFPNATYLAKYLLTLPVHSYLTKIDIDKIITIFYNILK